MNKNRLLASIPAVNDFLAADTAKKLIEKHSRKKFLQILREELDKIRNKILNYNFENKEFYELKLDKNEILNKIATKLEAETKQGIKEVINASGVIIHTNLGRSLLAESAVRKVTEVAAQYSSLEFNLETGERGYRYQQIKTLLKDLTQAESAVVVNNNAAAVLLVLTALAKNKEVILARGEMVEIGGSFRIPEVMENSGAILKEVGSTNKVYIDDYLNAVNEETGAIMKVHTSNYRIEGFTHSVKAADMVSAAHKNDLPVIEDLGSGVLFDISNYGLPPEPTVKEGIKAGIDVLTFSGDKLLGGPQAGIIVGKKKYINIIESHPLMRALRVDKMTLAALEETLKLYYNFEEAISKIPTLKFITENEENVKKRAENLISKINEYPEINSKIIKTAAKVGGGAYPISSFASYGVELSLTEISVEKFYYKLRQLTRPIIARINSDRLIFDLKTVKKEDIKELADSINQILSEVFK